MNKYLVLLIGVFGSAFGQVPEPVGPQTRPVLLLNGIAHVGDGTRIERSAIAFENGTITWVSAHDVFRGDVSRYEVVDVSGQHVYPGLILPASRVGLEDVEALRPTRDFREVGELNPHIRSLIAYNTDSELIPTARYNGVLLAQVAPEGGVISGTSSIMMLEGWNWEDAVYAADEGIHVRWPARPKPDDKKAVKAHADKLHNLKQFLSEARTYAKTSARAPLKKNVKLEAMRRAFGDQAKLYIHVHHHKDILEALQFFFSEDIRNVVLVGASDAGYVADFLLEHHVPVLVAYPHRLPARIDEAVDAPYRLPAELHKKGLLVGLTHYHRHGSVRNLPFVAGTVAAYGLDKEEALRLVTSNTAKILGIESRTGTIAVGKDANIVVSKGDLLDMKSNQVRVAFVQGKRIQLKAKQEMLYERFMRKYNKTPKY